MMCFNACGSHWAIPLGSPFKKELAIELQEVLIADSLQLLVPLGYASSLEVKNRLFLRNPQTMMEYSKDTWLWLYLPNMGPL